MMGLLVWFRESVKANTSSTGLLGNKANVSAIVCERTSPVFLAINKHSITEFKYRHLWAFRFALRT